MNINRYRFNIIAQPSLFIRGGFLALGLSSCAAIADMSSADTTRSNLGEQPFNSIYSMVPHNSYEYQLNNNSQSGLSLLLNKGYQSLEIDVFNKSGTGNDYVSHLSNGNANSCKANSANGSLEDCLRVINKWILQNKPSEPITLFVDLKDIKNWSIDEFKKLESTISTQLSDVNLIKPKDVLAWTAKHGGGGQSLRRSIARIGWPTLYSLSKIGGVMVFYTAGSPSFYQQAIEQIASELQGFPCPKVEAASDFTADGTAFGISKDASQWVVCGNLHWRDDDHAKGILAQAQQSNQINHIWEIRDDLDFDRYSDLSKALRFGAQFINRNDYDAPSSFNGKINKQGIEHFRK